MTMGEIEIVVTAKVTEALKKFQKIVPVIKQQMKLAQEAFSKVDMSIFTKKVQQAMVLVKKKIEMLKNSSKNNELKIAVNNEEAKKQISQIQKEIDSLQRKISNRQTKLNITNDTLNGIRNNTEQNVKQEMPNADEETIKSETNKRLDGNENYTSLLKESGKLNSEIAKYGSLLDTADSKMLQLKQATVQTANSQSKTTNFFTAFKGKMGQAKPIIDGMKNAFGHITKIAKSITGHILSIGKGLKQGLGNVIKNVGALFSLKNIYSTLSNSANSWLSSQNSQAQQLSANIEYMKYAMGGVFAPIIEYVVGLVYQLMKAIQSVAYAMTGVNIFAKSTAASMGKTAGSAKQASKSLAGVHNEINNISGNNDGGGGNGGGAAPNIDLSEMDNQMSPLAQNLYDFFKPLADSWSTYGTGLIEQVQTTASKIGGLISSVWGSFENIITNGTVYAILENIFGIIGNIAEAFSNAWNHNGNGDAIVQNIADAFKNLLTAIDNVVKNEKFQAFLKNCSDKFKTISEKISEIDWEPLLKVLSDIGENVGNLALDILDGLIDVFKWLVENPIVAEIILAIAVAIGIVSAAISLFNTAIAIYDAIMPIATAVSKAFGISIGWLIAIIVAIIAVIALIVLAIMNWDKVVQALKDTWDWICQQAQIIWTAIAEFFAKLWQGICEAATSIWNAISEFFTGLWEGIKNVIMTVWNTIKEFFTTCFNTIKGIFENIWNGIISFVSNIINGIKNTISNVLNVIKAVWNNIWFGIKNTVVNIWNGIWNGIKWVINLILGGIERFVNGAIKGINFLLGGISDVANAVGSLIGLNPINLKLQYISLPRLAKGGVLTEATMLIAGEYSGARTNPEIVTPQNIMYDTMKMALEDSDISNVDGRPIRVQIFWGTKNVVDEIIDGINEKTRQTGKAQIKVAYD